MNIREMIYEIHPDLKEKHETKQYEISNELIKYKVQNNLNQKEMAKIIGISIEDYLDLEYCLDHKGSLDKYEQALSKIKHYKSVKPNL